MADKNTENNENVETEKKKEKRFDIAGTLKKNVVPITCTVAGALVGALGAAAYVKTTAKTVEPVTTNRREPEPIEVPTTETEEVIDS